MRQARNAPMLAAASLLLLLAVPLAAQEGGDAPPPCDAELCVAIEPTDELGARMEDEALRAEQVLEGLRIVVEGGAEAPAMRLIVATYVGGNLADVARSEPREPTGERGVPSDFFVPNDFFLERAPAQGQWIPGSQWVNAAEWSERPPGLMEQGATVELVEHDRVLSMAVVPVEATGGMVVRPIFAAPQPQLGSPEAY